MIDPKAHDEAEAALFEEMAKAQRNLDSHIDRMHYMAGDRKDYVGRRQVWRMTGAQVDDQLRFLGDKRDLSYSMTGTEALRHEGELRTALAEIQVAIHEMEEIYREHRWTRWFPCLNRDGHIHSSLRGCPSVRWDTQMGWTPELSGKSIETAVAELGEALCSICFPAAPVAWQSKTLGQVKDERTRAEREAAKAARDAAKYAKRLFDSEVFRVNEGRHGERIETVAACKDALRKEVEFRDYYGHGQHPSHASWAEAAETAKVVLLAREARLAGTGATQAEIVRIIDNATKKNRQAGARI